MVNVYIIRRYLTAENKHVRQYAVRETNLLSEKKLETFLIFFFGKTEEGRLLIRKLNDKKMCFFFFLRKGTWLLDGYNHASLFSVAP